MVHDGVSANFGGKVITIASSFHELYENKSAVVFLNTDYTYDIELIKEEQTIGNRIKSART